MFTNGKQHLFLWQQTVNVRTFGENSRIFNIFFEIIPLLLDYQTIFEHLPIFTLEKFNLSLKLFRKSCSYY